MELSRSSCFHHTEYRPVRLFFRAFSSCSFHIVQKSVARFIEQVEHFLKTIRSTIVWIRNGLALTVGRIIQHQRSLLLCKIEIFWTPILSSFHNFLVVARVHPDNSIEFLQILFVEGARSRCERNTSFGSSLHHPGVRRVAFVIRPAPFSEPIWISTSGATGIDFVRCSFALPFHYGFEHRLCSRTPTDVAKANEQNARLTRRHSHPAAPWS
mmetsp:Transcript_45471/g.176822  ORF Transcript_45471/g.176822 Transcript_45471/m.176822 type:complete len:212 (-) Transcript_45471:864-1499(-)